MSSEIYTLFPILHPEIYEKYKIATACFWFVEDIDITEDKKDWNTKLTQKEKDFIKYILAFFAASDGIVMENLVSEFYTETKNAEGRNFYAFQMAMEAIHCVAPETLILTDKGHYPISNLVNQKINVWNGKEFSITTVKKIQDNAKLLKVKLDNNMELFCTEDHKWIIQDGDPQRKRFKKVKTKDLVKGDRIFKYELPVIDNKNNDFLYPYTHGFFCGDGHYCNNYPCISLYSDKKKLFRYMNVSSNKIGKVVNDKIVCYLDKQINKKFTVPINYSLNVKLRWLEGLCDADGCISAGPSGIKGIQVTSIELNFLKDIQLMLQTLGVNATIGTACEETDKWLPNSKGDYDSYHCKKVWCLYITGWYTYKLKQLGFNPKRLDINGPTPHYHCDKFIRVSDIIDENRYDETYCFNESKKHMGIFNGILTGQSELYSLLIDTYIQSDIEKKKLFSAIETIPVVQEKAKWAMKWINQELPWEQRLVAFAMVEGIFFSGAFCSIYWLKSRGLMPGLSLSNDLISRDEGLHMEHACAQYKLIPSDKRIDAKIVYQMVGEAVSIEDGFVEEALTFNLKGMNAKLMKQYVRYVADRLLTMLGYDILYDVEMPFDFMEMIGMGLKMNFFEGRNGEYQRSNILEVYRQRFAEARSKMFNVEEKEERIDPKEILKILKKFADENGLPSVVAEKWFSNNNNNDDNHEVYEELKLSNDF